MSLIGIVAAVLLTTVPAATAIPGDPGDPTDPEPCLPVGSPFCEPDPVPDIHLPWAGMELPTISVGLSSVRTVSVSNQGDPGSVLVLEEPTFTGEASTSEFALDAAASTCDDGGWPRELAAGQHCTLGVRFAPVVAGHRTGTMRLASNDPDELPQFSLYGTALTPCEAALRLGRHRLRRPRRRHHHRAHGDAHQHRSGEVLRVRDRARCRC